MDTRLSLRRVLHLLTPSTQVYPPVSAVGPSSPVTIDNVKTKIKGKLTHLLFRLEEVMNFWEGIVTPSDLSSKNFIQTFYSKSPICSECNVKSDW